MDSNNFNQSIKGFFWGVGFVIESPRVHRRPVCLSQATLPDSFKLS